MNLATEMALLTEHWKLAATAHTEGERAVSDADMREFVHRIRAAAMSGQRTLRWNGPITLGCGRSARAASTPERRGFLHEVARRLRLPEMGFEAVVWENDGTVTLGISW